MQVNREAAVTMMPIAAAEIQRLKLKRLKRGECPDCGNLLYKTTTGMLGRVRKSIPINEEGKCYDGRCLECLPLNSTEFIDHNNDENRYDNCNQVEKTMQNLAAPTSTEVKRTPIPRIILTYQSSSLMQGGGTLPETNNSSSGSKLDLGLFGLDLDDELSEITLDRRIRHNGKHKIKDFMNADMNATKNDSSHRDDDENDQPDADMSDKSLSKHNPSHTSPGFAAALTGPDSIQESYRNKMNQLFALPVSINHNETLQVRMARLLEIDVPDSRTKNISHIPDEEIDSEPYSVINNVSHNERLTATIHTNYEVRVDDPEQPFPHNRKVQPNSEHKLESADYIVEEIGDGDDNDRLNGTEADLRRQSGHVRKSGQNTNHSRRHIFANKKGTKSPLSARKIFRPDNVFVSQLSLRNIHTSTGNDTFLQDVTVESKPNSGATIATPEDIVLNRPDLLIEQTLPDKHFVKSPESQFVRPEILSDHQMPRNKVFDTPGSNTPKSVKDVRIVTPSSEEIIPIKHEENPNADIVFDFTAIMTIVKDGKVDFREHNTNEESHLTGDDSLHGFATENSSTQNHDTDYSAYSSKLLMMLEGADGENEYSTGSTWPSLRVQCNKADDDDDFTNAFSSSKSAEATNVTGDVYKETGIPKVVYSSKAENNLANDEAATTPTSENETQEVRRLSPLPIPTISPKTSPNRTSTLSQKAPLLNSGLIKPSGVSQFEPREEIDHLLSELEKRPVQNCESFLSRLTEILWIGNEDQIIRQHFVHRDGAKILATTMWAGMSFPSVEGAAFRLFFALIAVEQSESYQWNDDLAGLIDALLVAMQTIISDAEIQKVGCRIFCCLSSQHGDNNDGTRSGACLAVLNAMDAHASDESVQEWGLRALYNQCVFSEDADANKRIVVTSKLDTSGSTCFDVLERIVRLREYDLRRSGVMEWLYRLYWCLTSGCAISIDNVHLRMDSIRELLMMLEKCCAATDASPQLQEAGLGLIANLMRIDYYKSFLGTPDVVLLVLDTMHSSKEIVQVQIEACNVVASVSILLAPVDKEELIDAGIIQTIVGALYAFPSDKTTLQESALQALLGLASESEIAKAEICESRTLSVLMQICRLDDDSTQSQQELLCKLLASLYSSDRLLMKAVQCDTIGALTAAMSTFRNSEKIAEAGCCAYRNLTRTDDNFDALTRCNAIGFVVLSMIAYSQSRTIQINCCWVMWNLGVGTDVGLQKIIETNAMKEIIRTIQTHLDSYDVIDVACGTLWSLIHRSDVLRQDFYDSPTGLEAVVCTLMMHPDKTPLLEKVCGILAYTSRNLHNIPAEVISSGVSNVVETMCNNPRSLMILQHGAHFLRNVIAAHFEYAIHESVNVVAVVMNALKGSDVPVPFLGEVLYFLWVMAEISPPAKSKIITMDGIPVAMSILDQFRGGRIPFVEDPALGLFKELADKSSNFT